MPKRISKKQRDESQTTDPVVALATSDAPEIDRAAISRVMAAMGRKGGRIGGKRSLETMSPAERKRRAQKAAKTRWK